MTPTATTDSRIAMHIASGITRLELRHPPLNVIDIAMMDELSHGLTEIEANPEIVGVIVASHGESFSAGVDVAAHAPDKIAEMLAKFHQVIRTLVATKKVTIAAVRGHCLGGGAELAMVCDMVFTAEDATWGFPEIKLACYPPVACAALAALIGQKRAADLILTGRTISGREAAEIGLATRAVPASELASAVDERIHQLQNLSRAALAITKKASYAWDAAHFDKGLARAEKIYLDELMKTEDAQEGIKAFLDKKQPNWRGK